MKKTEFVSEFVLSDESPLARFGMYDILDAAVCKDVHSRKDLPAVPFMLGRKSIYYLPSSDRYDRRIEPYDEPVASSDGHRLLEPELRVAFLSGRKSVPVEQYDLAEHLIRSAVQVDPAVVKDGPVRGAEHAEFHIEHIRDSNCPRI